MHVLVVNFELNGVSEQQYSQLCDDIAPAFAAVPRSEEHTSELQSL